VFLLILAMTVFLAVCRSPFWYHAVITSAPLPVMIRNVGANCSTIGLYFITITWQQIFKGSLPVTESIASLTDLVLNLASFSHCQQ